MKTLSSLKQKAKQMQPPLRKYIETSQSWTPLGRILVKRQCHTGQISLNMLASFAGDTVNPTSLASHRDRTTVLMPHHSNNKKPPTSISSATLFCLNYSKIICYYIQLHVFLNGF